MGATLVAALAGACGGGSGADPSGTAGNTGAGGSGMGIAGATGSGGIAGTPAVGCGHTCAEYAAECGMVQPAQCDLIYECPRCREPLVCGGQGVPNRCARPGTWTIDQTVAPLLFGDVTAIWGTASNDVWAADSWGRVIWWNGSVWQLGADFGVGVTTIHGSDFNNVWFGLADGSVWQLVGVDLTHHRVAGGGISALFAAAPSDVFACDAFYCWRWNGQTWTLNVPTETGAEDAWAPPGGPLYVVSNRGWMQKWDGQTWTAVFMRGSGYQFLSIRGTDATHIWAAGDELMRLSEGSWRTASNPGQLFGYYTGVWPSGPRDVWAVGTAGLIQHGDGQFFETEPSPTTTDLLAVWGSGPMNIWAGGGSGMMLHYTGAP